MVRDPVWIFIHERFDQYVQIKSIFNSQYNKYMHYIDIESNIIFIDIKSNIIFNILIALAALYVNNKTGIL